jgi:probable addiction module antidote protein
MAIETKLYDSADHLETPEHVVAYIDAWLEDGTAEELLFALKAVARSQGMSAMAKEAGISSEALYKVLEEHGALTLEVLIKVLGMFGLRLSIVPIAAHAAEQKP